jgi:hypothetical protein
MRSIRSVFFLCIATLYSCSNTPIIKVPVSSNLEISVALNDKDHYFDFSKFITDSIDFTQLESSEKTLVGTVSKIQLHQDHLIIMDVPGRDLSIFNKNSGKFIHQISYSRNDDIRDFCVIEDTLVTLNYKKIHKLSVQRYLSVGELNLEDPDLIADNPVNFSYFSDKTFYTWQDIETKKDENKCYLNKYSSGKHVESYLPHSEGFKSFGLGKFNRAYTGEYYFSPAINLTDVYKVTQDTVSLLARLKFEPPITRAYLESIQNSMAYSTLVLQNEFYKDVSKIIKITPDVFYFECIGPGSYGYSGLFSVQKRKIIEFGKKDFLHSPSPFYADGKYLYAWYEPNQILRIINEGKAGNIFHKHIASSALKVKKTDNIIIVKIKIHEKL